MSDTVIRIPRESIRPGPNHRTHFAAAALEELADSINQHGLAQPITVRPMGRGYEIVCGERRFRAIADYLEWGEVPCLIRELSDEEANAIMLAENTGRVDLDPIDEAHAYQRTIELYGWPMTRIASAAGVSETRVANRIKLLALQPEIRDLVATGNLPIGLAEELAPLDSNRQRIAMRWLNAQPATPTRKTFARITGKLLSEQQQESLFDLALFAAPAVEQAVAESEGKLADLLPRLPELPELPKRDGTTGEIVDRYVCQLLDDGHDREARVILDFWAKILDVNGLRLSAYESQTLQQHGPRLLRAKGVDHGTERTSV